VRKEVYEGRSGGNDDKHMKSKGTAYSQSGIYFANHCMSLPPAPLPAPEALQHTATPESS